MLKVFRDNLKYLSWVLWFVIAVFILFVFVDFGGTVPGGGGGVSDVAARVGRDEISFGEFQRAYQQTESAYRQAYGEQFSTEMARQLGLPGQVLEGLIAETILRREAERIGLAVSDSELRREILGFPVFKNEDGRFIGQDAYARVLRNAGYTVEGFEASIRSDLLTDKLRSVLEQNVFVSAAEVEKSYRDRVERAKVKLLKLPASRFVDEVTPSEEEIATWFDSHRDMYRLPERRTVDYLLVDRAELQASLEIAEEEIESYYRENQEEFQTEEQVKARHILLRVNEERSAEEAAAKLEEIRTRIEGGEEFAALAEQLSEDPGSKGRGGDLGFFGRGQMVPEFEAAAFEASPGEVVGPVVTGFGAHLIRVEDRREAGVETLETVSERIRSRLLAERARAAAEAKAQELAERMRTEKIEDAAAMRALAGGQTGVSFATVERFGEDDQIPGIGRATAFTVAAFDLEPGATSDPVKIGRGWALLRLAAVEEPRAAELDEVRERVEADLGEERRQELAMDGLRDAATRLENGESLDAVAAALELEIEETAEFGRGGIVGSLGRHPRLTAEALRLDAEQVGGPLRYEGGAVLFQVVERSRFDAAEFEEQRRETREQLEAERFQALLSSLIQERRQALKVSYAPELVENFGLLAEAPAGS